MSKVIQSLEVGSKKVINRFLLTIFGLGEKEGAGALGIIVKMCCIRITGRGEIYRFAGGVNMIYAE